MGPTWIVFAFHGICAEQHSAQELVSRVCTLSSQTVPAPPKEYEWDCNGKHIIRTRGDRGTNIVVTSSDLKVYANEQLTLKQVAERRNMCLTSLKNLVKKLGIKDWREFKKSIGTNGLP